MGDVYQDLLDKDDNPIRKCRDFGKRFPKNPSTRDINFLTEEELESLYKAAGKSSNRLLKPLVIFLANTGMRRSEALSLKWSDVDLANGFVHIRTSKNGKSRRVPLEKRAIQILEQLRLHNSKEYVFVTIYGRKYDKDAFLSPLKSAVKRAGIKKRVDLHTLRHSYGSNKIRRGWGLKKVSMILGHSDIRITSQIYTHLLDGDLKVSDDFRLHFDNEEIRVDIKESDMKTVITKALSETLNEVFLGASASLVATSSKDSESSRKKHSFSTITSKKSLPAPHMLPGANEAQLPCCKNQKVALKLLWILMS